MTEIIVEAPDLVAFGGELGHDVVWDQLERWGDASPEEHELFRSRFEFVATDAHTDGDLYQGTTLMQVIRRKSDGRLFGWSYWQGGGKHGESFRESNGDDFADELPEIQYDWDTHDWASDDPTPDWYVFQPVERHDLPAYRFTKESA